MAIQDAISLLTFCLFHAVADLKVGNKKLCGENFCDTHEYCTNVDQICRQCSTICDPGNHNRQDQLCEQQCQDFLHDSRYQHIANHDDGIYGQLQKLQVISTTALIISLILAAILIVIATYWLKTQRLTWLKKYKNQNKPPPSSSITNEKLKIQIDQQQQPTIATIRIPEETPSCVLADAVRGGGLSTPQTEYTHLTTFKSAPTHAPDTPSSGVTNVSARSLQKNRFPSEDDTFAYDNPALTPSPILDKVAAAVRKGGDTVTVRA